MKRQLLKISLLGLLLLAGVSTQAQRVAEKKADKEYQAQAYIDAIRIYERIVNKGKANADVLRKLGDAYYFNGKLPEANKWYETLFDGEYDDKGKEPIPSEYYYRYAQTLKSIENYDKSREMMEKFSSLESNDSRVRLFKSNKDYLQEIEKKESTYDIKPININSVYSDYGATIFDNQLVFTSARNSQITKSIHEWTNESFTALYKASINKDDSLSEPSLFSKEITSLVNDATAIFTKDGNTMYFTRNNSTLKGKRKNNKNKSSLLKIYKSSKNKKGKWSKALELPFNSDNFNTAHPSLTPDGKWLYFSSDREGTLGQSDIFRVQIYSDGNYGQVENLGSVINTAGRETFPFISRDNYLFFASDGHPGLGGLDIFVSKINEDGSLSQVVNMGTPINSPFDDFSFYLNDVSDSGFISSNRPGLNEGDNIYCFKVSQCNTLVDGIVYDIQTKELIKDAKVTLLDNSNNTIKVIVTDSKGSYLFNDLDCKKQYTIVAEKQGYNKVQESFDITGKESYKSLKIGLTKVKESVDVNDDLFKKLKLNTIYFDFDKSSIRPDAAKELSKVVEILQKYPTMKIDVRSHTDSRGNDNYNYQLSDRRAKSTIQWIIKQGIASDRVKGRGYGETELHNKCSNGVKCSKEQHQLNRRSEFIILSL